MTTTKTKAATQLDAGGGGVGMNGVEARFAANMPDKHLYMVECIERAVMDGAKDHELAFVVRLLVHRMHCGQKACQPLVGLEDEDESCQ